MAQGDVTIQLPYAAAGERLILKGMDAAGVPRTLTTQSWGNPSGFVTTDYVSASFGSFGGTVAATQGIGSTSGDVYAAGGFRCLVGPFVKNAVPAARALATLARGADGAAVVTVTMARAGSIVGITASIDQPITAGTMSFQVAKNGAPIAGCVMTFTAADNGGYRVKVTFAKDTYAFAAGDFLTLLMATDAGFLPVNGNLSADIEIEE